jgi:nitrate reductase cytochrome c-type subunit
MKPIHLVALILILTSCKDANTPVATPKSSESSVEEVADIDRQYPGKIILENECYICHNPKASQSNMIGPPMVAIKLHYIDSNTTKEQFTEALLHWINDPEQAGKIPGAHKRFGSMPYMPQPDTMIRQVAEYLYDNEVERPEWFDKNFEARYRKGDGQGMGMGVFKEWTAPDPEATYAKTGLEYAKATQGALGRNLVKAIQQNGTVGAIRFCNDKAIKLTDSMSVMHNAIIKRVTDKPRNPNNLANADELGYINAFKELVSAQVAVEPIVKNDNGEVAFYYPITTNAMCLQCHGKPNDQIAPAVMAALNSLYPNDKAIGYDVNEVRGMWSIVFEDANE